MRRLALALALMLSACAAPQVVEREVIVYVTPEPTVEPTPEVVYVTPEPTATPTPTPDCRFPSVENRMSGACPTPEVVICEPDPTGYDEDGIVILPRVHAIDDPCPAGTHRVQP
jgi:hypothetical protein